MSQTADNISPDVAAADEGPAEPIFLNRELSWLAFNDRVLEEAMDEATPLVERLRFLSIVNTNLDEFFMIRVSGLMQQVNAGIEVVSADGMSPRAQLKAIHERLVPALAASQRCLTQSVLPAFEANGVRVRHYADLGKKKRARWDDWFDRSVLPILTPLATGPTQPFPFISNLSLNFGMYVRSRSGEERFARVKVPPTLPRLVRISEGNDAKTPPLEFLPIEELIGANLHKLFPGVEVDTPWLFRVTRDADFELKEDEANDLLTAIQEELRKRRFGEAVRLEVPTGMPERVRSHLMRGLNLHENAVYEIDGVMDVPSYGRQLLDVDVPELRYTPFVPAHPPAITDSDIFADIRAGDVLLHHPFESFAPVVDFITEAARDPAVLAIKQTLYRTSGDSPVIAALETAAENGKQVAAIVELKARFDEENNIVWAQRLEQVGVHVIYGVPGLKTHSKLALVIRKEGDVLRRYAHIGTGNYNPTTARLYTDLGLFTTDPDITRDVADLFNRLTGFANPPSYRKLLVAPRHMRKQLVGFIRREAEEARAGRPARIIAKCNAITDATIIQELYEASLAGVPIDLLVRGICCLRPGVPGLSENIRVRSVVGRFLEHSRVYWFENGGEPRVYLGSADWMGRNLVRRVEVCTPVENPALVRWMRDVYLERYLNDTERSRLMRSDGSFERIRDREPDGPDVHMQFMQDSGG